MSYLYRCNHCGQRKSLPKLHTDYIRPPKCKACKSLLTYRDVWQEKKNKDPENLCYCDQLPFKPHRKASTVWCEAHVTGPTEEDYKQRYGE